MLDLKKLEAGIDRMLAKETKRSIRKWFNEYRNKPKRLWFRKYITSSLSKGGDGE